MKIRSHSESHIVELEDGSRWKIFPGDLDTTLLWKPETDLQVQAIDDDICSHVLFNAADRTTVRVISSSEGWPVHDVKSSLKDG